MKLVWVNRFNADGSYKPMSEWQLRTTKPEDKYYFKDKYSDFDGFLEAECEFEVLDTVGQGYLIEYIGNQRGDGWFYAADGDLPPIEDNAVLCHDDVGVRLMMPRALHKPNTWEYQNTVKCWQPIQPPKHLD